ncbi:hypothetical protein E4U43_005183 [Claviceps pusilla]|uniref:Uncharacterized protein n=1 Tax=Claviceps pusilla TaxID=123648 RepID=A0A9P7SVM6_9HYPO|nr:hypothetical protein E4U43_005183 [Claviceps pusilla]
MTETMVTVQTGMQCNFQQVQDDLAHLFSRNMTFNPDCHVSRSRDISKQQEPTLHLPASPAPQPIVYSVSQHYNHSAHIARSSAQQPPQQPQTQPQTQPQRRSSEPPLTEIPPVEDILRSHGLDPAILTPSQLQLFRIAHDAQKLRLLELWSIYPPNKADEIPALAWSSTSVDQEEQMARLRYERHQNTTMSLDGTPVQTPAGQWTQQQHETPQSEPYMSSGYEELMRREYERQCHQNKSRDVYPHFGSAIGGCHYSRATEPVYKSPYLAEGQQQQQQQQQLAMASQYGAATMDMDAMDM